MLSACQTSSKRPESTDLDISTSPLHRDDDPNTIARSNHLHRLLLNHFPEVNNPAIQAYIKRVAAKITSSLPPIKYCCRYYLIKMNTVNAFSLPNGNIYITVKLLRLLDSEAQLAAVLSHEIAHVASRHSVKDSLNKSTTYKVYRELHRRGQSKRLNDISLTLGRAYIRGYKREIEREADLLGLKYLILSGYHPAAMGEVFSRIKLHFSTNRLHRKYVKIVYTRDRGIFASYPSFDERIKHSNAFVARYIEHKPANFSNSLVHGRTSFARIKRISSRLSINAR